jgi:hypothetical protein
VTQERGLRVSVYFESINYFRILKKSNANQKVTYTSGSVGLTSESGCAILLFVAVHAYKRYYVSCQTLSEISRQASRVWRNVVELLNSGERFLWNGTRAH